MNVETTFKCFGDLINDTLILRPLEEADADYKKRILRVVKERFEKETFSEKEMINVTPNREICL